VSALSVWNGDLLGGLYLLFSTAAASFDQQQYAFVALGYHSHCHRPTGLIPAFVIVAWRERRPAIAYAAAAGGGYFCLACIVQFILATFSFCTGTARMASLAWVFLAGLVEDADANFSWHDELEAWLD